MAKQRGLSPGTTFSIQMGLVWGIALLYYFAHPDLNGPRRLPHGRVETVAEEFSNLVAPDAEIEVVASGYHWVEGPLWVPTGPRMADGVVLFSDVIGNTIHVYDPAASERGKAQPFMHPSGALDPAVLARDMLEPGSNGLALEPPPLSQTAANGRPRRLLACDHGNRRVYRLEVDASNAVRAMDANERAQLARTSIAAKTVEGKRFNSPNDLVFRPVAAPTELQQNYAYDLYFTDPSYGLVPRNRSISKGEVSPERELDINGVYRMRYTYSASDPTQVPTVSESELVVSTMTRPNGIGFSPDGSTLYVANSNRSEPHWAAFSVDTVSGAVDIESQRVFADAAPLRFGSHVVRKEREKQVELQKQKHSQGDHKQKHDPTQPHPLQGSPDGLAVDNAGRVWATGPGGVLVFSPEGNHLGTVHTGVKTGNCMIGGDGYLYLAADSQLARLKLGPGVRAAPLHIGEEQPHEPTEYHKEL